MGVDQGFPGPVTQCTAVEGIHPAGSAAAGVVSVVAFGVSAGVCG